MLCGSLMPSCFSFIAVVITRFPPAESPTNSIFSPVLPVKNKIKQGFEKKAACLIYGNIHTTAKKLKQLGIKLPHSIFPFYPTTIVRSSVTPSRFLSLLDPLLPIGVLYSCLEVI